MTSSPPSQPGGRARVAALVAVAVLVVAVWAVSQAISRHNRMQNCLDSGRRDCDTRLQNP